MPSARRSFAALAMVGVVGASSVGCAGSGSDADATTTSAPDATTTPTTEATSSTEASTTAAPSSTTTTTPGLEGATTAQRSAPPDGDEIALLRTVRLGAHDGFERIVFEFTGTSQPGYTVEWIDGPPRADGSGDVVEVAGDAHLEVRMSPASGVDLSSADAAVVYDGPDRLSDANLTEVLEVVRTGDFEAVLTWVAGASSAVPFRVTRLADPARLIIDLEAS
ncbi:MAG: hypothetical protein KDA97_06455 [Acidimicrobiales bacterium]|nr:hypothetical protein [Acidimicrobiales bacterium]